MSEENQGDPTFEKLRQFLFSIGFDQPASINNTQAFRHRECGTLLMLSIPQDGKTVRSADWLSVLVRLENEGLVSQSVLSQLKRGKLPLAS